MSCYIYDRNPQKYGGHQEKWLKQSETVVDQTVGMIAAGKTFQEILTHMGQQRQQIAKDRDQKDWQMFGAFRSPSANSELEGTAQLTALTFEYQEYGDRLLQIVYQNLKKMDYSLTDFKQQEMRLEETYLGRKASVTFDVYDHHRMAKEQLSDPQMIYQELLKHDPFVIFSQQMQGAEKEKVNEFIKSPQRVRTLKQTQPDLYKYVKMASIWTSIYSIFPSPRATKDSDGMVSAGEGDRRNLKSGYVIATPRFEVNGKLYALSPLTTWFYMTFQTDPVDRMRECSKMSVVHQDLFLVDEMLDEITKVFQQAVQWDRKTESLETLKERVALLRYEYAHAMPFKRGSAATGEWLERAIYRHHGFELTYKQDTLVDLEALTALLPSRFFSRYDQMIALTPRSASP
ncbi:MAG: hypothetical protein KDK65_02625 [Chlamydiia bacterium]|nr:hypothetical protein [Chlamydiia bacterium]